jgi:hypothetical protein
VGGEEKAETPGPSEGNGAGLITSDEKEPGLQENLIATPDCRLLRPAEYQSWKQVPDGLRCRRAWLRQNRRVKKHAYPAGFLTPNPASSCPDSSEQYVQRLPLFSIDQTRPYQPTERTKATWEYSRLFLSHCRKNNYIKKIIGANSEALEPRGWLTVTDNGDPYFRYLGDRQAATHVNHFHVFGMKNNGGLTNFLIIDLDYHYGDRTLFLQMAEKLMDRFYGKHTWHLQVDKNDLQGIHFIRVLDKPVLLDWAIQDLREELVVLDRENPDLVARAEQVGKPCFSKLELYPSETKPVRLPLARQRTLVLDQYVEPIKRGKRSVGDVERYVSWLKDPNRTYKNKEDVLEFLRICTPEQLEPSSQAKNPRDRQQHLAEHSDSPAWRKNLRKLRNAFFLDGIHNGIPLNEFLLVMARASVAYGKSDTQIKTGLVKLVQELPEQARTASGRLRRQDWNALERQIDWVIAVARDLGHQPDPIKSEQKWKRVAERLYQLGEDPLNKGTWHRQQTVDRRFNWTRIQRQNQFERLAGLLCTTSSALVFRFVDYTANLVTRRQNRTLSLKYFQTCFAEHFPDLSFTNRNKLSRVVHELRSLGVIQRISRGYCGVSSLYTLGPASLAASSQHQQPAKHQHKPASRISSAPLRSSWQGLRPRHRRERADFTFKAGNRLTNKYPIPHRCIQETSICSGIKSRPHMLDISSPDPINSS